MKSSRFLAACALLWIAGLLTPAHAQNLPCATSYLGNTWGNGAIYSGGKWMQNNINGLWVKPDGTCYTNSFWDEGGNNGGIYQNGNLIGRLAFSHDNFEGGVAVTGDNSYVYAGNWLNIYVFNFNGTGVNQVSTNSTSTTDKSKSIKGLAADSANNLLFVTQDLDNQVQVWNKSSLTSGTGTKITSWSLSGPGACAAPGDGTVWVAQPATGTIFHYDKNGNLLPQQITGAAGFDPEALCFDNNGRLVVADNGPDQNLKIYTDLGNSLPTLAATFGTQYGIFSGTPGAVGPLKFSGLTGVGVDSSGNYYIGQNNVGKWAWWNGGGSILESYTSAGTRNWILSGLEFVDSAAADPASENGNALDVYTKYNHYTLDLSKTTPGAEPTWKGHTLNQFKYPQDVRYTQANNNSDYNGGTFVRQINGKKFLFVLDQNARRLLWYRFNPSTDGEVAIPSGLLESNAYYNVTYPNSPVSGEFLWRDSNGNGQMDAGEYQRGPGTPNAASGWWVDSHGDIWQSNNYTSTVGIRHWAVQGLDGCGNPIYSYTTGYSTYPVPTNSNGSPATGGGDLKRIVYLPATDTMVVASYDVSTAAPSAGDFLACFPNWSRGNRTPSWTISTTSQSNPAEAIAVAGNYVFVGFGNLGDNINSGRIKVYNLATGAYAGTIHAGPEVISISGTLDIPYGISACQRNNGEYLIFEEDDWHAKVLMFRWQSPTIVTDNLNDWTNLNLGYHTAGMTFDGSNANNYFDGDASRAYRSTDTTQAIVYGYNAITSFTASVYSSVGHPDPVTLGATKFYTSPDGNTWTPVSVTAPNNGSNNGSWAAYNYVPAGALPAGTNYLKVEFDPGTGYSWDPQLAQLSLTYAGGAYINDTSATINYVGPSWGYSNNRGVGDFQDDVHYATNNGDYFTWNFYGTSVSYITETDPNSGNVDIYLDDVYQTAVNCTGPSRAVQQVVYTASGLPAGNHTLKVVKVSGMFLVLDALVADSSYAVTTGAAPATGGTTTGSGNYLVGTNATVTATPNSGYAFLAWTQNGATISTNSNYTFAVTGNRSLTASFQPGSFAAWQSTVFTPAQAADPSISGALANPSGDGICNLLDYLYGLNPTVNNSGSGSLPQTSVTANGYAAITYQSNDFARDLTVTVEVSNDLESWYSGPGYTTAPAVLFDNGLVQTLQVISLLTPTNGEQFLRLSVTGP